MPLTDQQRQLAGLAVAIHSDLARPPSALPSDSLELPEFTWRDCRRRLSMVARAQQYAYHAAAAVLRGQLVSMLARLEADVNRLRTGIREPEPRRLWSPSDIYRDLLGLYEEFPEVEWNKDGATLSATTEPIELEGRYLGPFQIELQWRRIGGDAPYAVRAVDPQPSFPDSEVTHPHVQSEQLCEGAGVTAIRAALGEGRLLDFFLIVNNLLHTYNAGSPYVALDEWDGVRCTECDYPLGEDDARSCEKCNATLCDECDRRCCDCDQTRCALCRETCIACDKDVCTDCSKDCRDCGQSFCSSCLQDDERCPSCHEQTQEHQGDGPGSGDAAAAVQPVRLGEAALPAGSG